MTNSKQSLGHWGEDRAAEYLHSHGYAILARNIRTPHGEIDIVACKEEVLIFVEVKTRRSHSFAYPEISVTPRKLTFMLSAAETYLDQHPDSPETWQFDVIAIEGQPGGDIQI